MSAAPPDSSCRAFSGMLPHQYLCPMREYDGTKTHWTQTHLRRLRTLHIEGLYQEILKEYLLTYDYLTAKLERIEQRIEELASEKEYKEDVRKLSCFLGIKTHTALSVITETGDFRRFPDACHYAAFLGLTPGGRFQWR